MRRTEKEPGAETSLGKMLAENRRRNNRAPFDPISGKDAPGKRVKVVVKGLEPEVQYIPGDMSSEPFIKQLVEVGTVDHLLERLGVERNGVERARIASQWDRVRCRHDFYYWASVHVKIKNKEGDVTPFVTNAPQRKLIDCFENMRLAERPIRLVLLKARQWGGSTATQMYMAWLQLMHKKGWNSLIVGHQSSSAAEVGSMFDLMMQNYPVELLYDEGETVNPREAKIGNLHGTTSTRVVPRRNAKIKLGTAERPQSVRGGDASMVHCTEVAYWKRTEGKTPTQMMKSATSGVLHRPLTMIVYESSANGVGNFFHTEYEAAKNGESQFVSMFVAWYEIEQYTLPFTEANAPVGSVGNVPRFATVKELAKWMLLNRYVDEPLSERTVSGRYLWRLWERGASLEALNWYIAERTKYIDHADMASEFPSDDIEAFAHSGTRVFSMERLEEMRKSCRCAPIAGVIESETPSGPRSLQGLRFSQYESGQLKIWEMPSADTVCTDRYVVTVDIGGRSAKADWSVIWVADREPLMHGGAVKTVAQWRGHTDMDLLAWKAAQIAQFYNKALLVIESNTLETSEPDRQVDGDQSPYLLTLLDSHYTNLYRREGGRPGFHTNVATKPMVISTLVQAVREGLLDERDQLAIDELACYERRPDGSFGAITGKHDDMLMTRAIGLHVAFNELGVPVPVEKLGYRPKRHDLFSTL